SSSCLHCSGRIDSVGSALTLDLFEHRSLTALIFQITNDAPEINDTHSAYTKLLLHFLDGGQLTLPTFLPITADQHGGRFGISIFDETHDFAHGCTGSDDIINDQHLALQWCAHKDTALAVVLGFLPVITERHVPLIMI